MPLRSSRGGIFTFFANRWEHESADEQHFIAPGPERELPNFTVGYEKLR